MKQTDTLEFWVQNAPFRPLQFKLLIRVEDADEKVGSIYVPDNAKDRMQFAITRGTIVGVGPAAFSDHNQYPGDLTDKDGNVVENAIIPQIGDRVFFGKHAGAQLKGKDSITLYRCIEDTDLFGLIDDAEFAPVRDEL